MLGAMHITARCKSTIQQRAEQKLVAEFIQEKQLMVGGDPQMQSAFDT